MVASRRLRGASLVEIVVAIVVTSIALSGTLMLVDTTTRRSADPMLERQAISIGESYLEEILQKPFFDPDDGTLCPSPEADRDRYDNVCDYQGLDEIGARDQQGDAIAGLEGYRILVSVDTTASLGGLSGPADVVRVDATIVDPLGNTVRLSGYRTRS
ncbi:MAG: pilus assembly protein MshD [Spirochaetaceae bacterium]|nr:hypothetical protein [Myxococcales bacterium]MCB9724956.1 pilus assembly protein MshD [Spirochaetaceae bacterium]HPG25212.1 pilus assembly protein MshD [Myxococcota bacterium]